MDASFEPDSAIFGVFDGHGGPQVAKLCELQLISQLIKNPSYKLKDYDSALRQTFLGMDTFIDSDRGRKIILDLSKNRPKNQKKDSPFSDLFTTLPSNQFLYECQGCTSVVSLIKGSTLYVANAGDSRCVLAINGKAEDMSIDHKPQLAEQRKRIEKAGSQIVEGRVDGNLNLSRSIGDLKYKRQKFLKPQDQPITSFPDVRKKQLTKSVDFMILACDGIWEGKSSQQVVDFVYASMKKYPSKKLSGIIQDLFSQLVSPNFVTTGKYKFDKKYYNYYQLIAGIGCDNMTCIIVQFRHLY